MESENKNPETLDNVSNKIFFGTPQKRLADIKEILKEAQIFIGNDFLIVDTNELREKGSFSDAEILKIEEFIRQNSPDWYEEIRTEKLLKDTMTCTRDKGYIKLELLKLKEIEKIKFFELKKCLENPLKELEIKEQEEIERLKNETMEQLKQLENTEHTNMKAVKTRLTEIDSQINNDDVLLRSLTIEKTSLMREKFDLETECISLKEKIAKKESRWSIKCSLGLGKTDNSKSKLESELEEKNNRLQDVSDKINEINEKIRNTIR